ncbi:MAG: phosphate ABC transporter permease subunit PstC [Candidatus Omnitrophica bacterium]|nr:phosphate ABC transporter permease subunit PstC [Candidatus Omnitrophota bacterium]
MDFKDKFVEKVLFFLAFSAIFILGLITIFIFQEGLPLFFKTGFKEFFLGLKWSPLEGKFGILPMILGSLWVTFGALVFGVPLGLACAIFLSEFASKRLSNLLKPAIELLAGIPSVVYGFIGVMVLVPFIRVHFGGSGFSVLAGAIVLAVMILPTIISISIDALRAVPDSYREGSLALGANRWQTVHMVVLPAARSGIITSVILGMGRAVGETMAVIMVAGNATNIPHSVLDSTRTLTTNIALELGYAMGNHRHALFATGIVLFLFIMLLNGLVNISVGFKRRR